MTSGEDQKQVAISMCSTPSDRSLAVVAGSLSPRSTAGSKLVVPQPAESPGKSQHDDQEQQQGHTSVPLIKKVTTAKNPHINEFSFN